MQCPFSTLSFFLASQWLVVSSSVVKGSTFHEVDRQELKKYMNTLYFAQNAKYMYKVLFKIYCILSKNATRYHIFVTTGLPPPHAQFSTLSNKPTLNICLVNH